MFEVENGISNIVHVTSLGESYDHDDKFILVTSSYIHIPTEIFLYITVILICTVSRHIVRKSFSYSSVRYKRYCHSYSFEKGECNTSEFRYLSKHSRQYLFASGVYALCSHKLSWRFTQYAMKNTYW